MREVDGASAQDVQELLPCRNGGLTVRVRGENGSPLLLHSLYDPVREAMALVPAKITTDTIVFFGTGLGYHIPPILAANPHIRRVLIVERYPELAMRVESLIDNSRLTVSVISPSATGDLSKLPPIPEDLVSADITLISHPPSIRANPDWYASCRQEFWLAGKKRATPGRRREGPLTILAMFDSYYCQREAIRAFSRLGHRVVVHDCQGGEQRLADGVCKLIHDERPDLVFTVNMRGLDSRGVIAGMLERLGIPLALWFVDSPEFILREEALPPSANTTIFLWEAAYADWIRARGYRTIYLPLAADEELLHAALPAERYRAGISFVGNSLVGGFLSRLASRFPKNPQTTTLAEQGIERIISARGRQLNALAEFMPAADDLPAGDARLFFQAYVLHGATTRYRTQLLERLLPEGVAFFGDPAGWQRLFGPQIKAHPDVHYYEETPAVYASADINFNATSMQMPTAVNQRVFDVPLCGGFLLTDRQESLAGLFAADEVATYVDADDLVAKVGYYRQAPLLRREIAEKARRRVLAEHTYQARMRTLLAKIFG